VTPAARSALSRARWAITALFAVNGAALGSWVARIPVVQESLGLDEAALGTALLGLSVGVVTALPVAGGFVARRGARPIAAIGSLGIGIALPALPLAGEAAGLFAVLALFGAGMSTMDVAMNAHGVAVEARLGRPVMVSFHGAWSLGGLAGTGLGSLAIAGGLSTAAHLTISGIAIGAIGLAAVLVSRGTDTARRNEPGPALAFPRGPLWLIGLVAGSSALGEGAVADWSGVYLRDAAGAAPATAALGFLVFSLTMAAMRFAGDRVAGRFGPATTVRAGGLLAGAGLLLALAVPVVPVALAGFALAGVGLAAVVPLSFAVAGRSGVVSEGEAVAGVATIAYSALLAGPPFIGFVAHAVDLTFALFLVGLMVASLVVSGRVLEP
jgi:hypothetical protein